MLIFATRKRQNGGMPTFLKQRKQMKIKGLQLILNRFDTFFGDIDFSNMPERESEEYRNLLLKTANDTMFSQGRYTNTTELTLELFDIKEVKMQAHDLHAINALSKDDRIRLSFYFDLKDMCYPLFKGEAINWTDFPWNLSDGEFSIDNMELYSFITSGDYPYLAAAILYSLKKQIWDNEKEFSSVARQEISDSFFYAVDHTWKNAHRGEEEMRKLEAEVCECAEKMWFIDNHMKVGKMLGFGILEQSIYDAFDTYVDTTYRHKQVSCAKEIGKYIREHIDLEAIKHDGNLQEMLAKRIREVMDKHGVKSPEMSFTMNIIFLDVLKVPLG